MEDYEVVVMLGDNLNDFSRDFYLTDVEQREDLVTQKRDNFGRKFVIFPNPTDGHWIRAIFGESEPPATLHKVAKHFARLQQQMLGGQGRSGS